MAVLKSEFKYYKPDTLNGGSDLLVRLKAGQAFVEEGAIQCRYCTPGMVLSGVTVKREGGQR